MDGLAGILISEGFLWLLVFFLRRVEGFLGLGFLVLRSRVFFEPGKMRLTAFSLWMRCADCPACCIADWSFQGWLLGGRAGWVGGCGKLEREAWMVGMVGYIDFYRVLAVKWWGRVCGLDYSTQRDSESTAVDGGVAGGGEGFGRDSLWKGSTSKLRKRL